MTDVESQSDLEALFQRLYALAKKEGRVFSFYDACRFIADMTDMDFDEVYERLVEVENGTI